MALARDVVVVRSVGSLVGSGSSRHDSSSLLVSTFDAARPPQPKRGRARGSFGESFGIARAAAGGVPGEAAGRVAFYKTRAPVAQPEIGARNITPERQSVWVRT